MRNRGQSQAELIRGLVIVHTGDGKGKTTAALGMMTRAWGRNMRVGVVQFLKQPEAQLGEARAAEQMGIDWLASGDGFTWESQDLDETEARAVRGWETTRDRIAANDYDLLILDEFT